MDIDWLLVLGNNMYFFLLSYLILGGVLKYIDDAFDETAFNKKIAMIVAPGLGILWAFTMIINDVSATILLAVVLGVLLKGKIDNSAHLVGFFSILIIVILAGIELMIMPLIFLTSAAVIDEVGNDVVGYNNKYLKNKRFRYKFALYFFGRRYLFKVALLYVSLLGVFPLYFLLAFILFDEAYIIVGLYGQSRRKSSSS